MPLNLNTNEVTGVDLNNTEVSEVRLNGQTVFSATKPPFEPVGSPIAYWPMDDGSGTTATDTVGSADMDLNGATFVPNSTAVGGFEIDFDGNRNADVPVSNQPSLGDSGTFLCTIEFDSFGSLNRIWSVDSGRTNRIMIRARDSGSKIEYFLDGTKRDFSFSFNTGEKYRIGFYWDNGDVRVFVNGNREHTDTYGGTINANNNTWDFMGLGGSQNVDGRADAFIMYNTGLSDQDISTDFSNQPWS